MPKLPEWAEGGRIIYDKELPFAFMRVGRRSMWSIYVKSGSDWALIEELSGTSLEKVRDRATRLLGESIDIFVKELHPGARHRHLRRDWNSHLCNAPYEFRTANNASDATCPLCIAIAIEDATTRAKEVGVDRIEEAREHVRQVREFNALGRLVTGEDATEKL